MTDYRKQYVVTLETGFKIQAEQLAKWEAKLKPECFIDLEKWAKETNDKVTDGDDVRRGADLTNFVETWKPFKDGDKVRGKVMLTGDVIEGYYRKGSYNIGLQKGNHYIKCQMVEGRDDFDFYQVFYDSLEIIDHDPKPKFNNLNK